MNDEKTVNIAQTGVLQAIKKGLLNRPNTCSLCNKECKPHGHHYDYNKPLDVIWLCPSCHSKQHPRGHWKELWLLKNDILTKEEEEEIYIELEKEEQTNNITKGDSAMQIKVLIKNIYGKEMIYPACERAHLFCSLIHQKTLTLDDLTHIKALGFDIVVESPKLNLEA